MEKRFRACENLSELSASQIVSPFFLLKFRLQSHFVAVNCGVFCCETSTLCRPEVSASSSVSIVYSVISGPQTFLISSTEWKFVKKLFCAVNVLYIYFLKMCWFENMGSITKVMNVEVKMSLGGFVHFYIWNRRIACRKNCCRFLPSATQEQVAAARLLLRIATQPVEKLHAFCHARGWQTNDMSHPAFTQARWNGAKIMAPRWRHDREKIPVRVSETKRVNITLPCFKSLTAADLSPKDDFDQLFNFQRPVISECTIVLHV